MKKTTKSKWNSVLSEVTERNAIAEIDSSDPKTFVKILTGVKDGRRWVSCVIDKRVQWLDPAKNMTFFEELEAAGYTLIDCTKKKEVG